MLCVVYGAEYRANLLQLTSSQSLRVTIFITNLAVVTRHGFMP